MHECKLSAYLIYREGLKGKVNIYGKFGSVVHDVLEGYGKYCVKQKVSTDYAEFDRIKVRHIPHLHESQLGEANEVLEFIKGSLNWAQYNAYDRVEIEERLYIDRNLQPCSEEDAYFSSGLDLVCFDFTDGVAYAIDWKSVRVIYTNKFMKESLQRKIYSWMLFKHHPEIHEVMFAFNFVRYGYQGPWNSMYREELDDIEQQIKEEISALEDLLSSDERPEATPSGHCFLCPMHGICESYLNAFQATERLETEEDAINLYKQYSLMKVRIKETEALLKIYIDNNKPIELANEIYGPVLEETTSFTDTFQVLEVMRELGIPNGAIYDILKFNKTGVNKILSRFKIPKEARKRVYDLASIGQHSKFKSKRKEDELTDEGDGLIIDPYI